MIIYNRILKNHKTFILKIVLKKKYFITASYKQLIQLFDQQIGLALPTPHRNLADAEDLALIGGIS